LVSSILPFLLVHDPSKKNHVQEKVVLKVKLLIRSIKHVKRYFQSLAPPLNLGETMKITLKKVNEELPFELKKKRTCDIY
jgi:hypothetical protein